MKAGPHTIPHCYVYSKSNQPSFLIIGIFTLQLATAVLFQNPVQLFALTPNNLTDAPSFAIVFMKKVPTTWNETMFLDGYPGKYCVMARRHGDHWYIAGVNAGKEPLKQKLMLPMLAGQRVSLYNDDKNKTAYTKEIVVNRNGELEIEMQGSGHFF